MRIDGNAVQNRAADTSAQGIVRTQPVAGGARADGATGAGAPEDSVEISEEARQLMGAQNTTSGGQQVRPEMVDRARMLLASRQYNDRAVLEKTADRIAQSIDLTA